MKAVLALVLALGMTSTSFAENFNDEQESVAVGATSAQTEALVTAVAETLVSIPGATVSTVINALKALFGESIPVSERTVARMFEHEDDNGRGK